MATGRPSKLTPELLDSVEAAFQAGGKLTVVARYLGISYQTFLNWYERGKAERERLDAAEMQHQQALDALQQEPPKRKRRPKRKAEPPVEPQPLPSEQPFLEFFERVEQGKGNLAMTCLITISNAASHDPAEAWKLLERLFPDDYKPQPSRLELTGKDGGAIQTETAQVVIYRLPDNGRGDAASDPGGDETPAS